MGRNITEVKIHGNQLLEKIDQDDLTKTQIHLKPLIITSMSNSWKASLQQVVQNWMTTVLDLLKSGKLRLRRTIDQGDLIELLGERHEKSDLITRKFFSTEPRNPYGTENHFVTDQGQPDNINSQEVADSKFHHGKRYNRIRIVCRIEIIRESSEYQVRKRQKKISNVTEEEEEHSIFGECLWL